MTDPNEQGHPIPGHLETRRVMIRMSVVFPVDVLKESTPEFVNFSYNEGTHCISNDLLTLVDRYVGDDDEPPTSGLACACDLRYRDQIKFEYVREATEVDY